MKCSRCTQASITINIIHHRCARRDPRFPHVKVLQAALLCQQIAAFAKACGQGESLPVILAGDLNSLWRKSQPDAFDPVGGVGKTVARNQWVTVGEICPVSGPLR